MTYHLVNSGGSILILADNGESFLMKNHIQQINPLDNHRVRIDMGNCGQSYVLDIRTIYEPIFVDASELIGQLNTWISNCLNRHPLTGG